MRFRKLTALLLCCLLCLAAAAQAVFAQEPVQALDTPQTTESAKTPADGAEQDADTENTDSETQPQLPTFELTYQGNIENEGMSPVHTGNGVLGTTGKSQKLESLQMNIPSEWGTVRYKSHIENRGWEADYTKNNGMSGTVGKNLGLQAVQIEFSGKAAEDYTLFYRAHVAGIGWLGWVKDGAEAGTTGLGLNIEALEVMCLPKNEAGPHDADAGYIDGAALAPAVVYSAHVQNVGWQAPVQNGATAGTTGRGLQMEALKVSAQGLEALGGQIESRAHCANAGWTDWTADGLSGTQGRGWALQAVELRLSGPAAAVYDVYYRVHAANYGWLSWAANGATAGTTGMNYPAEAVEIRLVRKGAGAPGDTARPAVTREYLQARAGLVYQAHVENVGWQNPVGAGAQAGTTGRNLSVEAFNLRGEQLNGGIRYQAHVSNIGWQGWKRDGETVGTTGRNLKMEAFQAELYGEAATSYDVYYQVHSEDYGWLGWAKNGQWAGTTGGDRKLQAVRIVLVVKGGPAPGSTQTPYVNAPPKPKPKPPAPAAPTGGDSVLIGINAQTLNFYRNGQLAMSTPVTTGLRGVYDTPTGNYYLRSKSRNVTLTGDGYASFVNYWMPFIGQSYGLHDADGWRSNYGGNVYIYDGSHGCVNMPYQAAATLYHNISVGTPIVIRYN